jgi:hypothetical protein
MKLTKKEKSFLFDRFNNMDFKEIRILQYSMFLVKDLEEATKERLNRVYIEEGLGNLEVYSQHGWNIFVFRRKYTRKSTEKVQFDPEYLAVIGGNTPEEAVDYVEDYLSSTTNQSFRNTHRDSVTIQGLLEVSLKELSESL